MTPSDKAEAERRYPDIADGGYIASRDRAAFLDGIKFAEERATLPAAGVGECAIRAINLAETFRRAATDKRMSAAMGEMAIIRAETLESFAETLRALATYPPPAPAGVDRERCPTCKGTGSRFPDAWRAAEYRHGSDVLPMEALLAQLRECGWRVGIHNDYRLNGEDFTFWLFTHEAGLFVKGEGRTDMEALTRVADQARRVFAPSP